MPKNAQGQVTYVKAVNKGTCAATPDSSRNQTPTYRNETVFLPSELEMGLDNYSPLSKANSTATKSEGTQGIDPKTYGYSYYADNSSRKKKYGDGGSDAAYWERSRYYTSSFPYAVCLVNNDGSANFGSYWSSYGLAPAFVVGN